MQATSILLLPSEEPYETVDLVVDRQNARFSDVDSATERSAYLTRHDQYKHYGTIKIIGNYTLEATVDLILKELPATPV